MLPEQVIERAQLWGLVIPVAVWEIRVGERALVFPSRSWVRNAYNQISQWWTDVRMSGSYGDGTTTCRDIYGSTLNARSAGKVGAPVGDTSYGIVFGRGTTSWSLDDYTLAQKIEHGDGPNQMQYQGVTITPTWNGGTNTWSIAISRTAINNSGSTITVSEIGLAYYTNSLDPRYVRILLARDVLTPAVNVADAQAITATYTLTLMFPED